VEESSKKGICPLSPTLSPQFVATSLLSLLPLLQSNTTRWREVGFDFFFDEVIRGVGLSVGGLSFPAHRQYFARCLFFARCRRSSLAVACSLSLFAHCRLFIRSRRSLLAVVVFARCRCLRSLSLSSLAVVCFFARCCLILHSMSFVSLLNVGWLLLLCSFVILLCSMLFFFALCCWTSKLVRLWASGPWFFAHSRVSLPFLAAAYGSSHNGIVLRSTSLVDGPNWTGDQPVDLLLSCLVTLGLEELLLDLVSSLTWNEALGSDKLNNLWGWLDNQLCNCYR